MFKEDLVEWQKVEREFVSRLMRYDVKSIEFSQGRFPDWDVKATFVKDWKTIERTYEIKDYGFIFPGHGGVMDRFDNLIFSGSLFFVLMQAIYLIF